MTVTLNGPYGGQLLGIAHTIDIFSRYGVIFLLFLVGLATIIGAFATVRGLNRLAVGLGMMPRGEVGLIFASIGKSLGVISSQLFSAIVLMVVITTLISPGLLKWSLRRGVDRSATPGSVP